MDPYMSVDTLLNRGQKIDLLKIHCRGNEFFFSSAYGPNNQHAQFDLFYKNH